MVAAQGIAKNGNHVHELASIRCLPGVRPGEKIIVQFIQLGRELAVQLLPNGGMVGRTDQIL